MTSPRRLLRLLLLPAMLAGGCAPVNWIVAQFAPPKKVQALYEPQKDQKFLVFVDDLLHPVTYDTVKRDLADLLGKQLLEHQIAREVIPQEKLAELMTARTDFNSMSVPAIGKAVGADQVLYVDVEEFSLKEFDTSPQWRGRLKVLVKVVDSQVGRLWPPDRPGGYPVAPIETPPEEHPSATYGTELSRTLAARAADRIAKLFYDHKVSAQQMDGESDP